MKSISDNALAQECLVSMRNQMMKGPEDRQLLQQVVGMGGSVEGYLYGGLTASLGIRSLLMSMGNRLADFKRVLDFGCGSARVLSWFRDVAESVDLHGCDINSDAIAWSKQNIPYASFVHNGPSPPLPYADNFFDFLYGISVFTHLDEPLQKQWLAEIARITQPGGLVFLSIHGTEASQQDLSPEEEATFRHRGFFYKRASDRPTVEGLPDFYQVAFHTEPYIEQEWSRFFDVVGYVRHGCAYYQEMVVLRKPRLQRATEKPWRLDLPMGVIDNPGLGSRSSRNGLSVWGWAIHPNGSDAIDLQVVVDGRILGVCRTGGSRPDVGQVFYAAQNASTSGYAVHLGTRWLRKGWHVIWIRGTESPLPLCASGFYIETSIGFRLWSRLLNEARKMKGE